MKFQSKNTESYNQTFSTAGLNVTLNTAYNTSAGPDKKFLKELPEPSTNFHLQIFNNI